MIIYVPDPVNIDGVEVGCLCTPARCDCLMRGRHTLVDVGLRAAREGVFDVGRYLRLAAKAVAIGGTAYAVVPDVFCDAEKTAENYMRYSRLLKAVGAEPVLVLQQFYDGLDAYGDLLTSVSTVAPPARRHCDVSCAERPRLCAERINRVLIRLARDMGLRMHLLGPAARVLKALGPALEDVYSFDTASYRRAPNSSAKKGLGGKWQAPNGEVARQWLLQWLRQAGVVR